MELRIEPDVIPPYLQIPDDLHSVQTLQFLGFQLASAKEIFDDFTSPEHENSNRMLGFVELAKIYLDAAESVADTFTGTEGQGDISKVVTLTQVFMGLDLDGDRFEAIDPPERPIFWNTIKDCVFEVLDCRYDFLRNLDSAILRREKAYRLLEEDKAARKARNRKKAEAKKAAKQKRKALKEAEVDEGRAKGDNLGKLLDQVEFADDAGEKRGAQASKDAKKAIKSVTI